MKIFTFLKKEKADIEVVDRKLEKFEKIFDGTVEMSKAAKMEFELLKQRLTGVVSRLSCLYLDPLFWVCVDEQKVKSQANSITRFSEIIGKFLEDFDLGPITTLRDSFSMRRQTIQANCGIMEERLDDEYKQFEQTNQKYNKEAAALREMFMQFAEQYQNPKVYYDVTHMYKTLQEMKSRLTSVTGLETEVINQIKDVNAKVYALVTLFNNSIKELTQNTLKSKRIVLEILRRACEGLKELSLGMNKTAKEFEPEIFFAKGSMEIFFSNFYQSLNNHLGLIPESPSEELLVKEAEKIEHMNQLTNGQLLSNEHLLDLADHLTEKLDLALKKISDHEAVVIQYINRFVDVVQILRTYDSQFTELKGTLQASSDSDEFFKTLYANYNTEMNFVMKNYFTFFDILQKGLRKAFKTSIENDLTTFEKRLLSKAERLQSKTKEVIHQVHTLRDLVTEARQKPEKEASLYLTVANSLKDIDRDMHGLFVALFQENEVFLQEPIQLLQRTLRSLEKVFHEIIEHADIENSFLSVIDDSEDAMLVTLKSDPTIKALIDKKVDIDIKNQLVFNSEHNIQQLYSAFNGVHNDWMRDVGGFLKPDSILKNTNFDRIHEKNPVNAGQDRKLPLEVELYLDLSEDDLNLLAANCFDTRMNRKNIPFNGSLLLMNNYLVFYSYSLTGTVNLLVPFDAIIDVKSKKNFIGLNNGVMVETKKGAIEFFLSGNTKREEFSKQLLDLINIHKVAETSSLKKEFAARPSYLTSRDGNPTRELLTDDQFDLCKIRTHMCLKKMRVGIFNSDNVFYNKKVQGVSLADACSLWFGLKPYIYESTPKSSFLYHWREVSGCENIEIASQSPLPTFLQPPGQGVEEFLQSPISSVTLTCFESPEKIKVKEKINIICTNPDQIAIIFSASSVQRLEYEGIMSIRQGADEDEYPEKDAGTVFIRIWRRRGLTIATQVKNIYSEKLVDFMVSVAEQKLLFLEGKPSKYSDMK